MTSRRMSLIQPKPVETSCRAFFLQLFLKTYPLKYNLLLAHFIDLSILQNYFCFYNKNTQCFLVLLYLFSFVLFNFIFGSQDCQTSYLALKTRLLAAIKQLCTKAISKY